LVGFFYIFKFFIPAVPESGGDSSVPFKPSSCVVSTPSSQNWKMAKGHPISRKMTFGDV